MECTRTNRNPREVFNTALGHKMEQFSRNLTSYLNADNVLGFPIQSNNYNCETNISDQGISIQIVLHHYPPVRPMIIEAPEMILQFLATIDSSGKMEYSLSNNFANPTNLKALAHRLPEGSCLMLQSDGSLTIEALEEPSMESSWGFSAPNQSMMGEIPQSVGDGFTTTNNGNSGGGLDPSIPANIAVFGGLVGGVEQSYKYGNHNIKYAQRINGKVRNAKILTRASHMNATKMATGLKLVGRGVTLVNLGVVGYQFANSDISGNDYARLTGSVIITGTAFIPLVGPLISIGLGVADSYGAFDDIYNYFE